MSETYVTQDEFKRLEARVSSAEQEADGEKMLSRYILTQARQNGDDLAILKTRIDRIEGKIDQLEQREDLPTIVASAMREVLRETRSR